MLAIQRLEAILDLLNTNGIVYVQELVEKFNVSDVTIRKDLNKLQKEGLIRRTHGGALLHTAKNIIPSTDLPVKPNISNREKLAEYAYQYIQPNDTIFIGSGYTCSLLAKFISIKDQISVITNSIDTISELKNKCKTLILVGGEVIYYDNHSFTASSKIDEYLKSYNISKAITSCSSIDMIHGISVGTEVSKHIFSSILKVSQSWFLLADHTKFNRVSPYKVSDITSPKYIFTDKILPSYSSQSNMFQVD